MRPENVEGDGRAATRLLSREGGRQLGPGYRCRFSSKATVLPVLSLGPPRAPSRESERVYSTAPEGECRLCPPSRPSEEVSSTWC
jgi:hypothetical protein